ncbi:SDR family oxidoreductase [Tuwongella immobilis]|uniref:Ketoreductase domain-containing protein n=1 Tax=Tuwongella immobilis TaxID=692036 RepID=A0A6C2YIV7_9BACT|nr:SDR family oxidoreductase [Tuwongella immobilis]VIP01179.1 3-ketoacyl-acp reductase : Short chain dehydrogenase family protein OS=Burkholderia pseudomallei GN=DP50_2210 PE=4 SV=1: adh_short [Tuwongella immobilis]VTR97784.1 3-ketoacyl-acp reductase : Short chain dehydrogenase family protein OS=Burkholderia pseudomallei GN=DP50_2210 PE=4 SV=1: adh_short [Tuwongella immobilis]
MGNGNIVGKVAIVTGASGGIGRGIAERLAKDGIAVVVNYAGNADRAAEVVRTIEANGGRAVASQADVGKSDEVGRLFDDAERQFGPVDILVNNAGRAIRKPLAEFTDDEFRLVFETNLGGAFFAMREAARRLRNGGRIVNISASFQGAPIPGYAVYAASKMAIEQMTAVLAKELGHRGITVNAIRPGPTDTDLFRHGKSEDVVKQFASQAALGRIGEPADIARVVAFLVSEEAGWITGQAFGVNGGYW